MGKHSTGKFETRQELVNEVASLLSREVRIITIADICKVDYSVTQVLSKSREVKELVNQIKRKKSNARV